ncbi:MAG: tyrosine-type recombinase/integrase [Bacteroidales bacterium]|nr:tyrosine-type recombinase/integrase [Candidatus Cacconaster equi]
MNEIVFNSALAPYMHAYMKEYATKGFNCYRHAFPLMQFDRYLTRSGYDKDFITETAYHGWTEWLNGHRDSTKYEYSTVVVSFIKYLTEMGHPCYIPRLPKFHESDFVPYVFTPEEMEKIFKACDEWRDRRHTVRNLAIIMPALLRLLYSTGMRVGEAVSIRNRDVDFERHVITLYHTKNGHERLAPLNESMEAVLKQYIHYRNKMPLPHVADPDSFLFTSPQGRRSQHSCSIWQRFNSILRDAGIPYQGGHHGPRVHDLRHTACVHSLVNMVWAGKDPYCCLPLLSTFMGHIHVTDTEHYLRLTQNMYPEIIKLDEIVTSPIKEIICNTVNTIGDEND